MPQKAFPYTSPKQDKRVKIYPWQYKEVKRYYKQVKSQRATARYYGVDKKTIAFVLRPARLLEYKARVKKRKPWLKYYDREKHRIAIAKYRARKRTFGLLEFKKGKA